MQIFGNLINTDCPCSVCSNKRPNNINSMAYNKYIGLFLIFYPRKWVLKFQISGYTLMEGSTFDFNLGNFKNYDELLASVAEISIAGSSQGLEFGSLSYGQWWYQRAGDDFSKPDRSGLTKWSELGTGSACNTQNGGACWDSESSGSQFYRQVVLPEHGEAVGDRSYPINCEYGLQSDNPTSPSGDKFSKKSENGARKCLNQEYSPQLPDSSRKGVSVYYDSDNLEKPFKKLVIAKGEEGKSQINSNDIGCRHITIRRVFKTMGHF